MKPHSLFFCTLLACAPLGSLVRAEEKPAPQTEAVPKGYAVERYTMLWEHSPFTTASAADVPEPAAKLVLAGVAKIGSEDIVTILNKDSQERILVTQTPNAQGYKLVSVEQNADPLKVVATLLKGTESLKLRFDPVLLTTQSKTAPPPGPNPMPPQQNGNPMSISTTMSISTQNTPPGGQPIERHVRRPPIPLPVIPNRVPSTPPNP